MASNAKQITAKLTAGLIKAQAEIKPAVIVICSEIQKGIQAEVDAGNMPEKDHLTTAVAKRAIDDFTDSLVYAHIYADTVIRQTVPKSVALDLSPGAKRAFDAVDVATIEKLQKQYKTNALEIVRGLDDHANKTIRNVIAKGLADGLMINDLKKDVSAAFVRLGISQAGYRVEAITRTQASLAFNAGKYNAEQDPDIADLIWGYTYSTVGDARVRDEHAAIDGVTLKKDDPFWQRNYPPNGWQCRCQAIPVFAPERQVKPPTDYAGPDEGFDFNPGDVFTGPGDGNTPPDPTPPDPQPTPDPVPPEPTPTPEPVQPEPVPEPTPAPEPVAIDFSPPTVVPFIDTHEKMQNFLSTDARLNALVDKAIAAGDISTDEIKKAEEKYNAAIEASEKAFDARHALILDLVEKATGTRPADVDKIIKYIRILDDGTEKVIDYNNAFAFFADVRLGEKIKGITEKQAAAADKKWSKLDKELQKTSDDLEKLGNAVNTLKRESAARKLEALHVDPDAELRIVFAGVTGAPNEVAGKIIQHKGEQAAEILSKLTQRRPTVIAVNDEDGNTVEYRQRLNGAAVEVEYLDPKSDDRAHAKLNGKEYVLDEHESVSVHLHEMGHLLEIVAGTIEKSDLFRRMRIDRSGKPMQQLNKVFKGSGYKDHEVGNDDDFGKNLGESSAYYAGKQYLYSDGTAYATEILSMGIEALYRDASAFAKNDPEYFKYVVATLRGYL